MQVETRAIVCAARAHGEHGAVVRLLTPDHGLVAAYIRGARGRRIRPLLIRGNIVAARFRWRTEAQLPQGEIELVHSRAPILGEPLPLAAVEWVTALVASALPERQPYPALYQGMAALLDAIEAAPSASGWSVGLARFEQLLLAQLGYGREAESSPLVLESLERSGERLFRDLLSGPTRSLEDSRARLVDRLRRALV